MGIGAPLELKKPASNSNGHHVSTLGERDDVPLSNLFFFVEKTHEGNALGLLTNQCTGEDFWRPRFIRITSFSFQRPIEAHI
jgi:hypothetical protein